MITFCRCWKRQWRDLWCDICEYKVMDPSECCYYTCDECGVTLDVDCVLGEFSYLKVGHISPGLDVVANNGLTRPLCSGCKVRCKFAFLVKKTIEESVGCFCTINCLNYGQVIMMIRKRKTRCLKLWTNSKDIKDTICYKFYTHIT